MANTPHNRGGLLSIPLRGPLTLAFVLLVLGSTVAAGWISYRAAYRSVEEEALASLAASAAARDKALSVAVARKRERTQATLESVVLGCGISGVMVTSCARDMLRPFLRAEHAYGAALYYGGRQPMRVGSFLGGGDQNPAGLPLAQSGPNQRTYITLAYTDRENALTLAVDFAVSPLVSTTELLRASTRVVARVGSEKMVLGEPGASRVEGALLTKQLGACLDGRGGSGRSGQQYLALRPSLALGNTCVAALRDEREILAPVLRLKSRIARVGLGFGVLGLALAYLMALVLARPLVRLRRRVRGFRQGDYDTPVPIVGVGEVRELAYAFTDMKDSLQAYRETLAENERRLAMAYKAARLWVWEYDLKSGEITWQDPAKEQAPRTTGLRAFLRRVHGEDRRAVCDAIRKAKHGGVFDAEYRVLRRREQGWMASWGQVVGPLRRRMVGVSLDATARKDAENLIRERDRLEASAEMAGSLAHEINNPLTSVLAALYMLGRQPTLDAATASYVEIADAETRRVAYLVNQILGLYHRSNVRVAVDVRSLLGQVIAACRPELDRKRQRVVFKSDRVVISGCREELAHAFTNILRNAMESSPEGADIRVRARLAHRADSHELGVRILIADRGPGIPAGDMPRVFDAFTGTKPQKGTGLGLWITRSTVLKHGGTIRIRASRGRQSGTVVAVFLPARSRGKTADTAKLLKAPSPAAATNSGLAG